jgi:hypothetical protein
VPVTRETGGDILDRLFSGEKVIVIATGKVEAGVDLGDITKDDVSVGGDSVTIDLPQPEILSASLDEEKRPVYRRWRRSKSPRGRTRSLIQPKTTRKIACVRSSLLWDSRRSGSANTLEQPSVRPKIGGLGALLVIPDRRWAGE